MIRLKKVGYIHHLNNFLKNLIFIISFNIFAEIKEQTKFFWIKYRSCSISKSEIKYLILHLVKDENWEKAPVYVSSDLSHNKN
jgi:hypothetical protein